MNGGGKPTLEVPTLSQHVRKQAPHRYPTSHLNKTSVGKQARGVLADISRQTDRQADIPLVADKSGTWHHMQVAICRPLIPLLH